MRRRLLNQQGEEGGIPKAGTYYHKKTGEIEAVRSSNMLYDYDGVVVSDGTMAFVVGIRIVYLSLRSSGTVVITDHEDGSFTTASMSACVSMDYYHNYAAGWCMSQFKGRGYLPSLTEMRLIRTYVTEIDLKRRELQYGSIFGNIYGENKYFWTSSTYNSSNGYVVNMSGTNSSDIYKSVTSNNYAVAVCSIKDYSNEYFKIKSTYSSSNTIKFKSTSSTYNRTIEISTDNGKTWTSKTSTTSGVTLATLNSGKELLIRGDNQLYGNTSNYNYFTSTGDFIVSGNIMSLLYKDDFADKTSLRGDYLFNHLFYNSYVRSAKDLFLPATTLTKACYLYMFYGCASLRYPPQLPATTLTTSCYYYMFYGCTKLAYAPLLPAPSLVDSCYTYMFYNCTYLRYVLCFATSNMTSGTGNAWLPDARTTSYAILHADAAFTLGAQWFRLPNDSPPISWTTTSMSITTANTGPRLVNPLLFNRKELSIYTSNSNVASITTGGDVIHTAASTVVNIVGAGRCAVYIQYYFGSDYANNATRSCSLIVTDPAPYISSVSVTNISNASEFTTNLSTDAYNCKYKRLYYTENSYTANGKFIKIKLEISGSYLNYATISFLDSYDPDLALSTLNFTEYDTRSVTASKITLYLLLSGKVSTLNPGDGSYGSGTLSGTTIRVNLSSNSYNRNALEYIITVCQNGSAAY